MIKNTLPDRSRNPGNLKMHIQQFKSFSTNAPIVGEDFLRGSTGCFISSFVFQTISKKTLCGKGFTSNMRDIFYMKIIATI